MYLFIGNTVYNTKFNTKSFIYGWYNKLNIFFNFVITHLVFLSPLQINKMIH